MSREARDLVLRLCAVLLLLLPSVTSSAPSHVADLDHHAIERQPHFATGNPDRETPSGGVDHEHGGSCVSHASCFGALPVAGALAEDRLCSAAWAIIGPDAHPSCAATPEVPPPIEQARA
jgi:hypothetical protein